MARLEAIDTILEDAEPYDVLMACAQAFAHAIAALLREARGRIQGRVSESSRRLHGRGAGRG
jgi:hypothetical protein